MRLRDIKFYVTISTHSGYGSAFVKEEQTEGIYKEIEVEGALHDIIMNNSHIIKVYDPYSRMDTDKYQGLLQIPI